MRDFFKEYKSQKLKKNITIIGLSLIFAFGINFLLFDTNVWNKLQTSIKDYGNTNNKISDDIYLQNEASWADLLSLKVGTSLQKVSEIRASILFDAENLKLTDFFSEDPNVEIIKISNVPWIFLLNIKYKTPIDLNLDSKIIKISYTKLKQEKSLINLAETMFISETKTYSLTNNGLEL